MAFSFALTNPPDVSKIVDPLFFSQPLIDPPKSKLNLYVKELIFCRLIGISRELIYIEIPPKRRFLLTLKF